MKTVQLTIEVQRKVGLKMTDSSDENMSILDSDEEFKIDDMLMEELLSDYEESSDISSSEDEAAPSTSTGTRPRKRQRGHESSAGGTRQAKR